VKFKVKEVCDLCKYGDEKGRCYIGVLCLENGIYTKFKLSEEIINKLVDECK